jgi:hypothetical protein
MKRDLLSLQIGDEFLSVGPSTVASSRIKRRMLRYRSILSISTHFSHIPPFHPEPDRIGMTNKRPFCFKAIFGRRRPGWLC